jgi:predicted DNA-binding protein YlxM (UPF0122 family)
MIGQCGGCPDRLRCDRLCPPAEAWASQDRRTQRDLLPLTPLGFGGEGAPLQCSEDREDEGDPFLGREEWKVVARARLYRRQDECLRLYYWLGLSQMEIAARLGISQPCVSKILKRAKARLFPRLKGIQMVREIRRMTRNRPELWEYYQSIESLVTAFARVLDQTPGLNEDGDEAAGAV